MEIWKDVNGFEGVYQVSNLGRIKSLAGFGKSVKKEKILKQKERRGYLQITLWKDSKGKPYRSHRLVAEHFVANVDNKPQVNHIDGNRKNNISSNLEWVTARENVYHSKNVTGNSKVISLQKLAQIVEKQRNMTAFELLELARPYFK